MSDLKICLFGRRRRASTIPPSTWYKSQKLLLGPGWRFQFERALSVSNNIAEGFERLTPKEPRNFLVIARGSAGEVRSMVGVVVRRQEMQPHVSQLREIRNIAESHLSFVIS
jgi:hypothetical protein